MPNYTKRQRVRPKEGGTESTKEFQSKGFRFSDSSSRALHELTEKHSIADGDLFVSELENITASCLQLRELRSNMPTHKQAVLAIESFKDAADKLLLLLHPTGLDSFSRDMLMLDSRKYRNQTGDYLTSTELLNELLTTTSQNAHAWLNPMDVDGTPQKLKSGKKKEHHIHLLGTGLRARFVQHQIQATTYENGPFVRILQILCNEVEQGLDAKEWARTILGRRKLKK